MAVVSFALLYSGRSASADMFGHRTYSEEWEVLVNSVLDNEFTVTAVMPPLGTPHRLDPAALVVGHDPSQSEDSPFIWRVAVKYDTQPNFPGATDPDGDKADPAEFPENPLLRPPVWRVTFADAQEPAREWYAVDDRDNIDAALTPVRNSAKLPFDPPLMVDVSRPVLSITTNVAETSLPYLISLEGAINDREWRGIPKWCARVMRPEAGSKFENGIAYVELKVDIALNKDTWLPKVLDAGKFELTTRTQPDGTQKSVWTKMRDPFNHETDEAQPLNGQGKRLAPGADPVFLRGLPKQWRLADFASLLGL